jgi:hypothetical protein
MPAYAAILALVEPNTSKNYATLMSTLAALGEGVQFNPGDDSAVSNFVCFHSMADLKTVCARIQEHLHPEDTLCVLDLKAGILVCPAAETKRLFQSVMSHT